MISDCDCGSTTCPSCGPAQGYSVERVWCPDSRKFVWRNPEEVEPSEGPIVYAPNGEIV